MSYSKVRNLFSRSRPLLGNMFTCGTLYCMGDISQQTLFKAPEQKYDWAGTKRIVGISFFGFGPIYHYWYKLLDRKLPGTAMKMVLRKLLLDQILCTPCCLAAFFIGLSIMEGDANPLAEFKEKGPKAYIVGMGFWPPAQLLNFAMVPPHLRTAYVSVCAFIWSNVLCYIKAGSTTEQSEANPVP